ncbi:MAG: M20 family metallopeptidase [Candidatus Thorarchaeota archaeon]
MSLERLRAQIVKDAQELEPYIINLRRTFHRYPETMYEEFKTAGRISTELSKMGYNPISVAKTGVMATISGEVSGPTIALRADIDALNVTEENTDLEYHSTIPGKMHACGHDAHMAMLLGAARLLQKHVKEVIGTVKLIFQPAEEGGGGGKRIVAEGHINDVDVIFGMHVWGTLPSGTIATIPRMMASADFFRVTVKGRGGHAASPHLTVDPTAVLADIYNALQKVCTREITPFQPVVISTPDISASKAHNVIPPFAVMKGTFRTMDPEIRNHILARLPQIVEGYCTAWRCEGEVVFNEGDMIPYPPVINHPEAMAKLKVVLDGFESVESMQPTMGAEDFAFYLERIKGCFMALGIYNEEKGTIYPTHHPKFEVDETILWKGTAVHALLGLLYSKV